MNLDIFFKSSMIRVVAAMQGLDEFSTKDLAIKSKISMQRVQNAVKELREEKLIKVIRFEHSGDCKMPIYQKQFKQIKFVINNQEFKLVS